jgi:hypothetical protein
VELRQLELAASRRAWSGAFEPASAIRTAATAQAARAMPLAATDSAASSPTDLAPASPLVMLAAMRWTACADRSHETRADFTAIAVSSGP